MLFFRNFLLRVGLEQNGTIIFIFSISQTFPTYFGMKRNDNFLFSLFPILFQHILPWNEFIMVFFNFFNFFAIFWKFSITHQVESKQNDNFLFSLFLILFQPILAWIEFIMVFFNFLNFFPFFLEFSVTRRVRTKRNDNFYFLYFSSFSNLLWLEMKP